MHTTFAPIRDMNQPAHSSTLATSTLAMPCQGVALVLHGLNVNPACFLPLIDELRQRGIGAVLCSLRGHGENYTPLAGCSSELSRLTAFRQVSYDTWRAEVTAAYEQAAAYAQSAGVPLFLVGYSLGGLLGCAQLVTTPPLTFARMVLLAPALSLRPYSYLPRFLARWPYLLLRSLAPPAYRANPATPVVAYQALYMALHHLQQQANAALNIPTLLFIDPADELVSLRGLQRFICQQQLTEWQLQPVHKTTTQAGPTAHHLIIDPASVGTASWQHMIAQITQHLLLNSKSLCHTGRRVEMYTSHNRF